MLAPHCKLDARDFKCADSCRSSYNTFKLDVLNPNGKQGRYTRDIEPVYSLKMRMTFLTTEFKSFGWSFIKSEMFDDVADILYIWTCFLPPIKSICFHPTLGRFNSISDISAFLTLKVNVCKNTNDTPINRFLSPLHLYAPRFYNEKVEKPHQLLFHIKQQT